MYMRILPTGFIAPCLPTKAERPPSGKMWLHEIKHDGFRVIARKDGPKVRLYSRPGNDLTYRFPLIVKSLARLRPRSCIIVLFVCMSSSSSCSQGDVSVANTSYASSEECYADGMKRASGRIVVCIGDLVGPPGDLVDQRPQRFGEPCVVERCATVSVRCPAASFEDSRDQRFAC